ncbi:hypothetical protein COT30_03265 [Candidatus Micrarchaeota archaeon CG08_land_8_20_14_0_20_49_17]|nr:MAG: hypothetical protein COT30_03265 [Candidatus Micrarchaeota archaeon CG08_land_8_20_14_0_20_49_17]
MICVLFSAGAGGVAFGWAAVGFVGGVIGVTGGVVGEVAGGCCPVHPNIITDAKTKSVNMK